jgi:K+-transporting ATPase ATPase C chain
MRNRLIKLLKLIKITVLFFIGLSMLTGVIYPAMVTGIAQLVFPYQANGSLIKEGENIRGSMLLGQEFNQDKFFHGRPSAVAYNTLPGGASNSGPLNQDWQKQVEERRTALQNLYGTKQIPTELLHASASGLDPEISPEAALLQVERVAKARGFREQQKSLLIGHLSSFKKFNPLFPEVQRINIMKLNMKLETDPQFQVN